MSKWLIKLGTVGQALQTAGVVDRSHVYFVDDSLPNVRAAKQLGWGSSVWYHEPGVATMEGGKVIEMKPEDIDIHARPFVDAIVGEIVELRNLWPEVFKK
jgi:pyrimidine and pyridine-specific 5'-nucleotidase